MATLYATRGLQASGKTTRAKAWVAEDPTHRARVNRDDLRLMVHAGFWDGENTEKLIIRMRNTLITTALKMGQDVVCDDTNLPSRTVRDLEKLAKLARAEFVVWDMTDVPLETCIERDAQRPHPAYVGKDVIRKAYERFVKGRPYPLPIGREQKKTAAADAVDPYVPDPQYDEAVIVDIDGTVAHMSGRSPYDETRVHEDTPNQPVIDMVKRLHKAGMKIIFLSGRTAKCYAPTARWLMQHVEIDDFALFMRPIGDSRKDNVVKRELFDRHVRHAKVNIVGVFDDRDQVVRMWRDELGLTVYQCAYGDF